MVDNGVIPVLGVTVCPPFFHAKENAMSPKQDSIDKIREFTKQLNGCNERSYVSILKRLKSLLEKQPLPEPLRKEIVQSLQTIIVECRDGNIASMWAVYCLGASMIWNENIRTWLRRQWSFENTRTRENVAEAITEVLRSKRNC